MLCVVDLGWLHVSFLAYAAFSIASRSSWTDLLLLPCSYYCLGTCVGELA